MIRIPIHPGTILRDELGEIGIGAAELARQLKVPENRMYEFMRGRRSITVDTALRLGRWFGASADFWMNLQKSHELRKAEQELGAEINQIKPCTVVAGQGN